MMMMTSVTVSIIKTKYSKEVRMRDEVALSLSPAMMIIIKSPASPIFIICASIMFLLMMTSLLLLLLLIMMMSFNSVSVSATATATATATCHLVCSCAETTRLVDKVESKWTLIYGR